MPSEDTYLGKADQSNLIHLPLPTKIASHNFMFSQSVTVTIVISHAICSYKSSFEYSGAKLYYDLPNDLKSMQSDSVFRKALLMQYLSPPR